MISNETVLFWNPRTDEKEMRYLALNTDGQVIAITPSERAHAESNALRKPSKN